MSSAEMGSNRTYPGISETAPQGRAQKMRQRRRDADIGDQAVRILRNIRTQICRHFTGMAKHDDCNRRSRVARIQKYWGAAAKR